MDNGTTNTKIELSPEEAERFKVFCRYYQQFAYLIECGIFERLRPGSAIIHLSASGEIGKIELHPIIVIK